MFRAFLRLTEPSFPNPAMCLHSSVHRQTQEGFATARGYGRGSQSRGHGGRGSGAGGGNGTLVLCPLLNILLPLPVLLCITQGGALFVVRLLGFIFSFMCLFAVYWS